MESNFHIESEGLPVNRSAAFSRKVVDNIRDLLLVLAEDGRVLYASHMCQSLTTFHPDALVGNFVTSFMHYDDLPVFLQDFKEGMTKGKAWRQHHRIRRQDDGFTPFESTFRPFTDTALATAAGLAVSKMCLMTARPHPMISTSELDSYLDHWTTQIRLRTQIQQLKEDLRDVQDPYQSTLSAAAVVQNGNNVQYTTLTATTTTFPIDMSSSPQASSVAGPSTHQENISETSSAKPLDSVMGDIGIEYTSSRLQVVKDTGLWAAKPRTKKRKEEAPKEHLCKECGTIDSPEWRRGPFGPKTLCNACGLRWSKSHRHDPSKE